MFLKKNYYNFINIYFLILLIFALSNIYRFYITHDGFRFADWLINYQGGFVRRGLFGSLLISLSNLTSIKIEIFYLLLISLFYSIFFYLAFCLIKKKSNNLNLFFLILSPLSFHFIVFETRATAAKEILLFLFFIILIFLFIKKIRLSFIFLYFHLFSIFVILNHEALVFYFSFIYLFLYFVQNKKNYLLIRYNIFFSIIILTIFSLLLFFYSGNDNQVKIICDFLEQKNIIVRHCDNLDIGHSAIAFLKSGTEKNNIYLKSTLDQIRMNNYLLTYFISFLVSFVPIFILIKDIKIKNSFLKLNFSQYLITCFFFIIPVFIALDWGRWLHISYILTILIIFGGIELKYLQIDYSNFFLKFNKKNYLLGFLLLYFFIIDVPICCANRVSSPFESIYNRINYFIGKI
jgi:hypothetical protein